MAAGDVTVFESHLQDLGRGVHNLETGTIKCGLITSSSTPTAGDTTAAWGDYSANEVTASGNYSAGGPSIGGTFSQTSGTATFDVSDISITQDANNPTNARWGIVYNDTAAADEAIAFLDLGTTVDLSAGDFTVTWDSNGLYTIS